METNWSHFSHSLQRDSSCMGAQFTVLLSSSCLHKYLSINIAKGHTTNSFHAYRPFAVIKSTSPQAVITLMARHWISLHVNHSMPSEWLPISQYKVHVVLGENMYAAVTWKQTDRQVEQKMMI